MRTHRTFIAGLVGFTSVTCTTVTAFAQQIPSSTHALPAARDDAKHVAATSTERNMHALADRWQRGGVQVGELARDLSIYSLEGKGMRMSRLWKDRPVVLITASLTCPMARGSGPLLQTIIDAHDPEARVIVLYVVDAHPNIDPSPYSPGREWLTPENERSNMLRRQPKSLEERLILANECDDRLKGVAPMFVDGMDNAVWKSLGGGPNMALLIDTDGTVIAKQAWLDVGEMNAAIDGLLRQRTASASGAYFSGKHARPRMRAFIEVLQADDLSAIDAYFARDARLWTGQKSGEGVPAGVDGRREWDQALGAKRLIESATIEANAVIVTANQVNDFDRLIDFAGERTRTTYWFNDAGEIEAVVREPLRVTPSFQASFKPALEWAKANRAMELRAIHPNNNLLLTADAANRWRALLTEWRAATGRTSNHQ